jgi:hypothetical protein
MGIHSSVGRAVHDIHLQIGLDEFMSGWMTFGHDCTAAGGFKKKSQVKYSLAFFLLFFHGLNMRLFGFSTSQIFTIVF